MGVKMKIILIRHGMTAGNKEKRYIGLTDEPLCGEGLEQIRDYVKAGRYPEADMVYVSPLRRCIETAELIYPGKEYILCDGLKECDFGEFENKNYLELAGNENYQKWIDSNGKMKFPSGEEPEGFKKRCQEAFGRIIKACENKEITLIVHGGTIMAILEKYGMPEKAFYDWQLKNGEGYLCELVADKPESVKSKGKPDEKKPAEERTAGTEGCKKKLDEERSAGTEGNKKRPDEDRQGQDRPNGQKADKNKPATEKPVIDYRNIKVLGKLGGTGGWT